MTRLAMLVLACLAIALGGLIAIESTPDTLIATAPLPADAIRLGPVAAPAGDLRQVQNWVDTILARPLFAPSRRPPSTPGASGTSGPGFPRLTGIVILPQQREAIFAVQGKTTPVVVTAGSRLNGVLIKSIEAGWVVVVDAAGARVIRPSFATAAASPAAAVPASITVDLPPVPPSSHASPFAFIRGLSGRPMGLSAQPDSPPPGGGAIDTGPNSPAPALPGGSP